MLSKVIENHTRVLAENQDEYNRLAIRDEETSYGNVMLSSWEPKPAELIALRRGAPVILSVLGSVHPPVGVSVGQAPADVELAWQLAARRLGTFLLRLDQPDTPGFAMLWADFCTVMGIEDPTQAEELRSGLKKGSQGW